MTAVPKIKPRPSQPPPPPPGLGIPETKDGGWSGAPPSPQEKAAQYKPDVPPAPPGLGIPETGRS